MSGQVDASRAMRLMSDRFFLDANIFVYSFDNTVPKKADLAARLIRRAIETREGIVSCQIVHEFFDVALRQFAEPMSGPDAEHYLSITFRPLLAVHSSHRFYGQALHLATTYSLSWYDSLIVASAIEGLCGVLYGEDFQDGQRFGNLRIENPFQ
jgi:predicted nucleic acid-binding protein